MRISKVIWAFALLFATTLTAADQVDRTAGVINAVPTITPRKLRPSRRKAFSSQSQAPTTATYPSEAEVVQGSTTPTPSAELDARRDRGDPMVLPTQKPGPWSGWCQPPEEWCRREGDKAHCKNGSIWKRTARPIAFATLQPRDDTALCLQSIAKNCKCAPTKKGFTTTRTASQTAETELGLIVDEANLGGGISMSMVIRDDELTASLVEWQLGTPRKKG